MSYIKVFAYSIVSVILCMFINLTLSVFGGSMFKIISAICTVGIMVCLQFNSAYNNAKEDMKNERITKKFIHKSRPFWLSLASSLLPIVSTVILWITAGDKSSEFYRIYKILNFNYLHIFNIINSYVTSDLFLCSHICAHSFFFFLFFSTHTHTHT